MSETNEAEVKARIAKIIEDHENDLKLRQLVMFLIVFALIQFNVFPFIIGAVVVIFWFAHWYLSDRAIEKTVDKLI